jgi:hypothetical protein
LVRLNSTPDTSDDVNVEKNSPKHCVEFVNDESFSKPSNKQRNIKSAQNKKNTLFESIPNSSSFLNRSCMLDNSAFFPFFGKNAKSEGNNEKNNEINKNINKSNGINSNNFLNKTSSFSDNYFVKEYFIKKTNNNSNNSIRGLNNNNINISNKLAMHLDELEKKSRSNYNNNNNNNNDNNNNNSNNIDYKDKNVDSVKNPSHINCKHSHLNPYLYSSSSSSSPLEVNKSKKIELCNNNDNALLSPSYSKNITICSKKNLNSLSFSSTINSSYTPNMVCKISKGNKKDVINSKPLDKSIDKEGNNKKYEYFAENEKKKKKYSLKKDGENLGEEFTGNGKIIQLQKIEREQKNDIEIEIETNENKNQTPREKNSFCNFSNTTENYKYKDLAESDNSSDYCYSRRSLKISSHSANTKVYFLDCFLFVYISFMSL